MNKDVIKDFYAKRGLGKSETERAVKALERLERRLEADGMNLEDVPLCEVRDYVEKMAETGESDETSMLALSRYFYLTGRSEIYIYLARVTGGIGVIDSIRNRMINIAGEQKTNEVFAGLDEPPLGTPAKERAQSL